MRLQGFNGGADASWNLQRGAQSQRFGMEYLAGNYYLSVKT